MVALARPITEEKIAEKVEEYSAAHVTALANDLLSFFIDRLKVQLREQGARHDLVDAVFALEGKDDLLLIIRRVEALGKFLDTEDGKNLLAGYKRATNIIRIEEKKDGTTYAGAPNRELYKQAEEEKLAFEIERAKLGATRAIENEDFEGAMSHLARLQAVCRRLLRQSHGQRRRQAAPREPAKAPQRNPRGDARGGRFLPN